MDAPLVSEALDLLIEEYECLLVKRLTEKEIY